MKRFQTFDNAPITKTWFSSFGKGDIGVFVLILQAD